MLMLVVHRCAAAAGRWAAAAVLLAAAAGCAGSGGGGGATATAPPTGGVSGLVTAAPAGGVGVAGVQPVPGALLCDVLTAEAIRAATGIDVVSSVAQDGTATECDYRAGDGSSVLVLQDRSQQLLPLGSTGAQVAAALQADGGATVLSISGAQAALLSHAGVPGVFLLAGGHWFYLSLPAAAVSDPTGAVTTLAAQAVPLLSTEVQ
ncbi:MAG TPA: hypothetical protein VI316_00015 [Candidatus Dormibacteraeota bacterium]